MSFLVLSMSVVASEAKKQQNTMIFERFQNRTKDENRGDTHHRRSLETEHVAKHEANRMVSRLPNSIFYMSLVALGVNK